MPEIFRPYPWQVELWRDKSPILLASGGAGGGKSLTCAEKLNAYLKKYPNATGLAVRKTRESMTNSTILFFQNMVVGGDPHVKHRPHLHRFEYSNGSMLIYGGMKDESQREHIRSIGKKGAVDIAWMEEANQFTEDDFNEIQTRMRGSAAPWSQTMLSTNPDAEMHWINQRLIIGGEASVHVSTAEDNPSLPDQYKETLDGLTGVYRDRMKFGRWVSAEGVIYDHFTFENNVIETSDMLPSWAHYKKIVGGADSNYPLPRAGLIGGIMPDGSIHIFEEFYEPKTHPEVLGQWYNNLCLKNNVHVEVFHDPSDQNAIDEIKRFQKVICGNADNEVIAGITEVNTRFKDKKLFVHNSCKNLIAQLNSYVWKNAEKMIPDKKHDHLVDALRYLVHSLPKHESAKQIGMFIGSRRKRYR